MYSVELPRWVRGWPAGAIPVSGLTAGPLPVGSGLTEPPTAPGKGSGVVGEEDDGVGLMVEPGLRLWRRRAR